MIAAAANRLWALAAAPAARRFAAALPLAGDAQRALLARLLRRHAGSAFGVAHAFADADPATFRARVPVQDWDAVAPWVERIAAGEPRVLGVDAVTRLVPTAGSSGGAKLVPWTRGLAAGFQAALAPWISDLFRCHPGAARGPAYWSVSPLAAPSRPGGHAPARPGAIPVGFDDDSAYLGAWLRPLVGRVLAAPSCLRFAEDAQAFRHATLRCLLARADLALISVWHPSFLELLLDAAVDLRGRLLRDLHDGGIGATLPTAARAGLGPWLGADRARARALERADWRDAHQLWPRLALVSCWGDAAAAPACAALRARLRGVAVQAKGLLATEGVVSIPWQGQQVLAVTSGVVEFVDDDGRAHWCDEVADGGEYTVVLSNGGGLWRYRLGDRVRVEGFAGRAPCLRFLGRAGAVSDLVGEKLAEDFIAGVLAALAPAGFAALQPRAGGYVLLAGDGVDPALAAAVERGLRANPHYDLARRLGQLAALRVVRVPLPAGACLAAIAAQRGLRLGECKPLALLPAAIRLPEAAHAG